MAPVPVIRPGLAALLHSSSALPFTIITPAAAPAVLLGSFTFAIRSWSGGFPEMDPTQIIQGQFGEAKRAYPSLQQQSFHEYRITLPAGAFQITLSPNYPARPPQITLNGVPIKTELTENWCCVFQLTQIIGQLVALSAVERAPNFTAKKDEIDAAIAEHPDADLTTPEGRATIVQAVPAVKCSKQKLEEMQELARDEEAKLPEYRNGLRTNLQHLEALYGQQVEMQRKLGVENPAVQRARAMGAKLTELANNGKQANDEAAKIQQQLEDGEIAVDVYMKQIVEAKRRQILTRYLSGFIESQMPR